MTKNIDSQEVEEQCYQVDLINSLVDIAQDNLDIIKESIIKYKNHEFTDNELILDVEHFVPKIDVLLKVLFDKSEYSKEQLYQIVSGSLHTYKRGGSDADK